MEAKVWTLAPVSNCTHPHAQGSRVGARGPCPSAGAVQGCAGLCREDAPSRGSVASVRWERAAPWREVRRRQDSGRPCLSRGSQASSSRPAEVGIGRGAGGSGGWGVGTAVRRCRVLWEAIRTGEGTAKSPGPAGSGRCPPTAAGGH